MVSSTRSSARLDFRAFPRIRCTSAAPPMIAPNAIAHLPRMTRL
jgi:hypothetical protein